MNDLELLSQQVVMSTSAAQPGQSVWVYRGSMWAYPWYTTVRVILDDPEYKDWFVGFKPGGSYPNGSYYSDPCDANNRTLCSDRYHNQVKTGAAS
jgi:hypothetical protein